MKANTVAFILMAFCAILAFGFAYWYSFSPVQEAPESIPETPEVPSQTIHVYHLGDQIYNSSISGSFSRYHYYFHGIVPHASANLGNPLYPDVLRIGQFYFGFEYGIGSDMLFMIQKGDVFQIENQKFKILDYGTDWIELEEEP